jgi:hypothetical protein
LSSLNILEALKKRRLKAVKSSITYGETRDAIVSEKAKAVKVTLADLHGTEVPKDAEEIRISGFYYRMVDEYFAKPVIRMPTTMTKRGLALWRRVVISCKASGVDPELYMRAQFDYFNKHFGRPPEVFQLATENAQERAIQFAAGGQTSKKIVGNDIRHKGDLASIMRIAEKQMQDVCRAQSLTREEVYKNLVIPGLLLFPKEYLEADPVYKRISSEDYFS